ncbi:MAG: hypothetical protein IMZ64_05730 [Bacteroidetes bacterium]|nr:hypothetical protein [Bacteroidota bacterium]
MITVLDAMVETDNNSRINVESYKEAVESLKPKCSKSWLFIKSYSDLLNHDILRHKVVVVTVSCDILSVWINSTVLKYIESFATYSRKLQSSLILILPSMDWLSKRIEYQMDITATVDAFVELMNLD